MNPIRSSESITNANALLLGAYLWELIGCLNGLFAE